MIFHYHRNEDERSSLVNPNRSDLDMPAPALTRAEAVVAFARECIGKEKNEERRVALVRQHIESMRLQPSQINSLRARANWANKEEHNLLVEIAAKSLLVDVPLRSISDASQLLDILQTSGRLPTAQRAAVEKKMRRYLAAAIHGKSFYPDLSFTSGNEMVSVEPLRGRVKAGEEYLYRDLDKAQTVNGWVRAQVLNAGPAKARVRFSDGRIGHLPHRGKMRPMYRIVARFGLPPKPRYVLMDTNESAPWLGYAAIATAFPVTRVASREWYMLATGEGEKERLRIVTLAAADDRWLHVVKTAYENVRIPRADWRLYRIDRYIPEAQATSEMKAQAISLAAHLDKAKEPSKKTGPAKLAQSPAPKASAAPAARLSAPKSVVIAASAGKRRTVNGSSVH